MERKSMVITNKAKAEEWFWKLRCTMYRPHGTVKSVTMCYNIDKKGYQIVWEKKVA